MYKCLKCGNKRKFIEYGIIRQELDCDEEGDINVITSEYTGDWIVDMVCGECEAEASQGEVVYWNDEEIGLYQV